MRRKGHISTRKDRISIIVSRLGSLVSKAKEREREREKARFYYTAIKCGKTNESRGTRISAVLSRVPLIIPTGVAVNSLKGYHDGEKVADAFCQPRTLRFKTQPPRKATRSTVSFVPCRRASIRLFSSFRAPR